MFPLLMRVVDRAGLLDLGDYGIEGLSALIDLPEEVLQPGLDALLKRGVVSMAGTHLLLPKFLDAQEAAASDVARQRKARELARDVAARDAILSEPVTKRDEMSRAVTACHEPSQVVTPSLPSRAVPSVPKVKTLAGSPPAAAKSTPVSAMGGMPAPPGLDRRDDSGTREAVDALRAAWNELTGPPVKRWDPPTPEKRQDDRRDLALRALKRRPLEEWRKVFAIIARSPHHNGDNDRGWVADPDYALRPRGTKPEPAAQALDGSGPFAFGSRETKGRAQGADTDWSTPAPRTDDGQIDVAAILGSRR